MSMRKRCRSLTAVIALAAIFSLLFAPAIPASAQSYANELSESLYLLENEFTNGPLESTGGPGWSWDKPTKTLTLSSVRLTANDTFAIKLPADSTIVVNGSAYISGGSSAYMAIHALGALTIRGGKLIVESANISKDNIPGYDGNSTSTYGIFSHKLTVSNCELTVSSGRASTSTSTEQKIYAYSCAISATEMTVTNSTLIARGGAASSESFSGGQSESASSVGISSTRNFSSVNSTITVCGGNTTNSGLAKSCTGTSLGLSGTTYNTFDGASAYFEAGKAASRSCAVDVYDLDISSCNFTAKASGDTKSSFGVKANKISVNGGVFTAEAARTERVFAAAVYNQLSIGSGLRISQPLSYRTESITYSGSSYTILYDTSTGQAATTLKISSGESNLSINGVGVKHSLETNGGVWIEPTREQMLEITASDSLVFDFGALEDVSEITLVLDKSWTKDYDYRLLIPGKCNLLIPAEIISIISELDRDNESIFKLHIVFEPFSFRFYYGFQYDVGPFSYTSPMILELPVEEGSADGLGFGNWGEVVSRCRYEDGYLRAVLYYPSAYKKMLLPDITFNDTDGGWMDAAVTHLAKRGVVSGTGGGNFTPERNVSRAEFVTMLVRSLQLTKLAGGAGEYPSLTDLDKSAYYYEHVLAARGVGIIQGRDDGSFGPDEAITRQDMFAMLHRAMTLCNMLPESISGTMPDYSDKSSVSGYAASAIEDLSRLGLVSGKGDGRLDPLGTSQRAEAAQVIYNMLRFDAMLA